MSTEKLMSTGELARKLDVPLHKLEYLFKSRKLKKEKFILLDGRQLVFREKDLARVKEALFSVGGVI